MSQHRDPRSTTEGDRKAACQGKWKFPNGTRAWRAVSRQLRKGDTKRAIYRCQFCGRWHQGTPTRSV